MSRVAFSIFGIEIYWYALIILFGMLMAFFIIEREAKKEKINKDFIDNLIFYSVIIGIIGARLYYVLFNLNYYLENPAEIIMIHNGGLAIHGGLITGALFVIYYSKKKKENVIKIFDIISPAIILAQSIGRWGNFINKEAYGSVTSLSFLEKIHVPNFVIKNMYIEGNYYLPTFFFESILCFIGFIILMIIRRKKKDKIGLVSGIYLIFYGIIRFFIEHFRTDSLLLFNFKIAQIVSILFIVVGIIFIYYSNKKSKEGVL